jgi:hypothetical protein
MQKNLEKVVVVKNFTVIFLLLVLIFFPPTTCFVFFFFSKSVVELGTFSLGPANQAPHVGVSAEFAELVDERLFWGVSSVLLTFFLFF